MIKMKFFYAETQKDGYGMRNLGDDMSVTSSSRGIRNIKGNQRALSIHPFKMWNCWNEKIWLLL